MTFLYPLGLLGLIGIPILIIIYIIKTKYTEQTIASTYLWTLSEKFLKRRNPFSWITGMTSLILQILAITLISFGIAHPMFTMPGAAYEYCFVLDASGSMSMAQGDSTRFELAKAQIAEAIEEAAPGSQFTLVVADENVTVVYERLTSQEMALSLLSEQQPGFDEDTMDLAVSQAQKYFNDNSGVKISVYTDAAHDVNENITLVNVAQTLDNFGIDNVTYAFSGGKLNVLGDLISYGGDDTLEVYLYVDGSEEAAAGYVGVVSPEAPARFQLSCPLESFYSLRIELVVEDALTEDNEVYIYDVKSDSAYNAAIISDAGLFLEMCLKAWGYSNYVTISPEEFETELQGEISGYGLYIFDCYSPEKLPDDGAVWLINPTVSTNDTGFSVQGQIDIGGAGMLDRSKSTSSMTRMLLENTAGNNIFISSYVRCSLYREFTTLYTYQSNPVIFAGTNNFGNREVVFAFDIHNSDIALLPDFVVLLKNCMEYSFPDVIEQSGYHVGDIAVINVLTGCEAIRVESPRGNVSYLSTSVATTELSLTEAGTYTITATVDGNMREFKLFAAMPESERYPESAATELMVQGQATEGGFDGLYDPLFILFICLAVIFALEWGVYCYEKRQLR